MDPIWNHFTGLVDGSEVTAQCKLCLKIQNKPSTRDAISIKCHDKYQAIMKQHLNNNTVIIYIIIIMHLYIVPEPGNPVLRRCTVLLSLTQTCFHPVHISTPKGAYNLFSHYRRKALFKHITIVSCQVLIFMDQ